MQVIARFTTLILAAGLCCLGDPLLGTFSAVTVNGHTYECISESSTPCQGSFTLPGTTSTAAYDSYGIASYGTLGSFVSATVQAVTSGPAPTQVDVVNDALFVDTFTFTGVGDCGGVPCALTGPGTIEMQVEVQGSTQNPNGADAGYIMIFNPGSDQNASSNSALSTTNSLVVSQPLSIVFGQPETFTLILFTAGAFDSFAADESFQVNYAQTATLVGFQVEDSNGNPVTDFGVTAASGTEYPDTAVPEPSSVMLLLSVALGIGLVLRRRICSGLGPANSWTGNPGQYTQTRISRKMPSGRPQ
jgi:hypothetical protein